MSARDIPIFVLCGGLGTRLQEETGTRPKAMVTLGGVPIVLHVMRWYRRFGFRRFILCTGFKSEAIKAYFLDYAALNTDFTVNLATRDLRFHGAHHDLDMEVTLAFTGTETMTGARVARAAAQYLGDSPEFGVTYCDGLTDADLGAELEFHRHHGRIGTVLGVNLASRFGEFRLEGDAAVEFVEKPAFRETWINGGYFFFRREFLRYLSEDEACVLEQAPLASLARDGELNVYRNRGYWACMDTLRDLNTLNELWNSGRAPWKL